MNENITPEVIKALAFLRKLTHTIEVQFAIAELDDAGIFAAIDEATGYDVDPEAGRISKCRCQAYSSNRDHETGCQGDPAEWGDTAYTSKPQAVETNRSREKAQQRKADQTARWQRAVGIRNTTR